MKGAIADRTMARIAAALRHDQVEASSHLRGQLGADSLDFCEIELQLEEEFGIRISDRDADAWETVHDVIATVERRLM